MSTALVKVAFHGDELEAVQKDGHVWASVKRMCENLGLEYSAQFRRIKRQSWGVIAIMATTAADGKVYETVMLRADKIPMWLATLNQSRIKEKVVLAKIIQYQNEAADVLARHFLAKKPPADREMVEVLHQLLNESRAIAARQEERVTALEQLMAVATARVPNPAVARATVRTYLREIGWHGATRRQREQIRKLTNARIDLANREGPDIPGGPDSGGPCVYYGWQIEYLRQAVREVRDAYEDQARKRGEPSLFDADAA